MGPETGPARGWDTPALPDLERTLAFPAQVVEPVGGMEFDLLVDSAAFWPRLRDDLAARTSGSSS